jgi:Ca-activated chloride channel family protein
VRFFYDFTTPLPLILLVIALAFVGVFVTLLVLASARRVRDERTFGEPSLVGRLVSHDASAPRLVKASLLVAALVLAIVAAARPQLPRGTRIVPATNLDVVVVLDYSKSMYARDVSPSRIARAKVEVSDLIKKLPGARFGAVAYAGEPMSFPLTSDGAAIAQFFRQLEPNDMPVGGTATARALERARELFARDPKSKDHVRVIVLVTDGEDLEGDPTRVAESCAAEGTRVDVVQVGGRAPEVIPEVSAEGKIVGIRRDENGKPLTTELSPEAEEQLKQVAEKGKGTLVRAQKGETGIEEIAKRLQRQMREELAERAETVHVDEYKWPLGLAVLLLLIEALVFEAPRRARRLLQPKSGGPA